MLEKGNTTLYVIISLLIIAVVAGGVWLFTRDKGQTDEVVDDTDITIDINSNTMILHTNKGKIVLELFRDNAPNTVENFEELSKAGFYDGTRFHRVVDGFMIQGGDPFSKDISLQDRWGTGGPGYTFDDEIYPENNNARGTISMANAGPNTNGSQFFINTADNTFLNPKHTVFGRVVEGMDVVEAISKSDTDPADRPLQEVVIERVEVVQ